jgi:hypothetical protein
VRRFVLVLLCVLAVPASARAWTWPVDGPVVRGFSFDPDHPYAAGQHRGIDLAAGAGTPVRAPTAGTVTFAGAVPNGGKTISIETPLGYTATLLHLGTIAVGRGAHVAEGAPVAAGGNDAFVYFGIRTTADPQGYVDPLGFLPARPAPTTRVGGGGTTPSRTAEPRAATAPAQPTDASAAAGATRPAASPSGDAAGKSSGADSAAVAGQAAPAVATPATATSGEAATPAASSAAPPAAAPVVPAEAVAPDATAAAPRGSATEEGDRGRNSPAAEADGVAVVNGLRTSVARPRPVAGAMSAHVRGAAAGRLRRPIADVTARAATSVPDAGRSPAASHTRAPGSSARATHPTSDAVSRTGGRSGGGVSDVVPLLVASIVAVLSLVTAFLLRRRLASRGTPARIMSGVGRSFEQEPILVGTAAQQEGPRRARVAVRERPTASRARGGVRGAGRHLRAVPPAEQSRRADGERNGRARDAGDGRRRPAERLAA